MTICIPAFEASGFIDRTLRCALGQTVRDIRVLVSVDLSRDNTLEICRDFAAADPRLEVIAHSDRQGWCANTNALIDRVGTEFFFLYFHDDLILPQYCEIMMGALDAEPTAASAHCTVQTFGQRDRLLRSAEFEGTTAARMLKALASSERGAPLRSVLRRDRLAADFRASRELTTVTPSEPLLMRILAAGPAVAVRDTLYLRWLRDAGLVTGWHKRPYEDFRLGWSHAIDEAFGIFDAEIDDPADRRVLRHAFVVFALQQLHRRARQEDRPQEGPEAFFPDGYDLDLPAGLERHDAGIVAELTQKRARILRTIGTI